jgi:DnaJ family protein B protein 4
MPVPGDKKMVYPRYTCDKSNCIASQRCIDCEEKKSHGFTYQDGGDLHYTIDLDLKEALTGWERTITTRNWRLIKIEKEGPTQHGSKDVFPNLGMPPSRDPNTIGNFVITYEVKFPKSLTPQQREELKKIL